MEVESGSRMEKVSDNLASSVSALSEGIGLLKEINSASTVLIVSIVSACLVLLIIAIVVAVLLCKKRQKPSDKYTNHDDVDERENSEAGTSRTSSGGDSASSSGTHAKENNNRTEPEMMGQDGNGTGNGEKPVHKWQIRPGVHVHVNGLHPLNKSGSSS